MNFRPLVWGVVVVAVWCSACGGESTRSADADRGCQAALLDDDRWTCFDATTLEPPHRTSTGECTYDLPDPISAERDSGRFGLVYSSDDDVFEIPQLPSPRSCDSGEGGWWFGFDDSNLASSIHVCACTCEALIEASVVLVFAECR